MASEAKHTAGPWVAIRYSVALSTSSGAWHVAECRHGFGHDDAEALANATLIAAAPDLYEAGSEYFRLEDAVLAYQGDNHAAWQDMCNRRAIAKATFRAAIAKATGTTPTPDAQGG